MGDELPAEVPALPLPPWWAVTDDPQAATRVVTRAPDGLAVRVLQGRRMQSPDGVFAEFARAWAFPGYFGKNWSALEDCLTDLSWTPSRGYLCVVTDADRLLHESAPAVLGLMIDLLDRVGEVWAAPVELGEPWDRGPVPFHTLLACGGETRLQRLTWRIIEATRPDERGRRG